MYLFSVKQLAAFNIQDALAWKEKIELVIYQVQFLMNGVYWN